MKVQNKVKTFLKWLGPVLVAIIIGFFVTTYILIPWTCQEKPLTQKHFDDQLAKLAMQISDTTRSLADSLNEKYPYGYYIFGIYNKEYSFPVTSPISDSLVFIDMAKSRFKIIDNYQLRVQLFITIKHPNGKYFTLKQILEQGMGENYQYMITGDSENFSYVIELIKLQNNLYTVVIGFGPPGHFDYIKPKSPAPIIIKKNSDQ